MLVELITLLLVGGLLVAFGLLLWKKQKIELLHDYHYRNVRPEDKGPYTRLVGQGLLCMGAGILLTGWFVVTGRWTKDQTGIGR